MKVLLDAFGKELVILKMGTCVNGLLCVEMRSFVQKIRLHLGDGSLIHIFYRYRLYTFPLSFNLIQTVFFFFLRSTLSSPYTYSLTTWFLLDRLHSILSVVSLTYGDSQFKLF